MTTSDGDSYKKYKILIADDSSGVRILVEKVLISLGFSKIFHANNGREALIHMEKAKEIGDPFNIILCDLNMPMIDGKGLIKKVRSSDISEIANIVFIIITAESGKETVLELIQSGIDGFIIKPVVRNGLFQKLNDILEKKNLPTIPASVLSIKI